MNIANDGFIELKREGFALLCEIKTSTDRKDHPTKKLDFLRSSCMTATLFLCSKGRIRFYMRLSSFFIVFDKYPIFSKN